MRRRPPRSTRFPLATLFGSLDTRCFHPPARFDRADGFEVGAGRDADVAQPPARDGAEVEQVGRDRKSTRLNSSHANISYAVFCLKKKPDTAQSPPPPCRIPS